MSEANVPPFTNRGAIRTSHNESYLHVLVDWLQITVKHSSPEEICEKLLKIPFNLMKEDSGSGTNGYRALYRLDNIRLLVSSGKNFGNGYQIYLSGSGCRNYELILEANGETWFDLFARVLSFEGANVPRIDLAIDDFKVYFSVPKLIKLAKAGRIVSRLRTGSQTGGFSLKDGSKKGNTLYIGSHSSLVFFRFYEKNYEQAEKYDVGVSEMSPWNRYEVVLRQQKAVRTLEKLVEKQSLRSVVMGIFKSSMRFVNVNPCDENRRRWKTWQPWEWFLKDIEVVELSVDPKEVTLESFFTWMQRSIAPSLKVLDEISKITGVNYIDVLISRAELQEKHKDMIERFSSQLELRRLMKQEREAMEI